MRGSPSPSPRGASRAQRVAILGILALVLAAASGGAACGTEPVGVEACKKIERIADGSERLNAPNGAAPPSQPPIASPRPMAERGPSTLSRATTVTPTSGRMFRRIELAPGVELSVADDAPPESRKMVEKILEGLHAKREGQGA